MKDFILVLIFLPILVLGQNEWLLGQENEAISRDHNYEFVYTSKSFFLEHELEEKKYNFTIKATDTKENTTNKTFTINKKIISPIIDTICWCDTILKDPHTRMVICFEKIGNARIIADTIEHNLYIDNTPPSIIITSPNIDNRGLKIVETGVTRTIIRGKITDKNGISSAYINSYRINNLANDGGFSLEYKLEEKKYNFTIKATDTKGNTANKTFTINKKIVSPIIDTIRWCDTILKDPQTRVVICFKKIGNEALISDTIAIIRNTTSLIPIEKRLALVIGNSNYSNLNDLKGKPINDAQDIASKLRGLDFEVIVITDANKQKLEREVHNFTQKLKDYDVGLFFYAGHGIGINGKNYIIPNDFPGNATKIDFAYKCVPMDWVQDKMGEAGLYKKTNIIIVDACRDDGGLRNARGSQSHKDTWVPPTKIPSGFITCYATSVGETAFNGNNRNGLYTSILLKHIGTQGLLIEAVFKRVRIELLQKGEQVPEEQTKLTEDFYFAQ